MCFYYDFKEVIQTYFHICIQTFSFKLNKHENQFALFAYVEKMTTSQVAQTRQAED